MMRMTLVAPTEQLLVAIADKRMFRDDIALDYALCLNDPEVDWRRVNEAILDRWSMAGLRYIKARAWKIVGAR